MLPYPDKGCNKKKLTTLKIKKSKEGRGMETKIALIFVILLILGAVGINKIIQDSNANTTQNNQVDTGINQVNTQINQQNTPNSPSAYDQNNNTSSGGNSGKIDSSGSTSSSGSKYEYK
ncbi:MAG: hypothetical protein HY802_02920 [Methanobacterium sp.]|nr:hypothetical protein [Methanobacterium sp.]